MSKGALRRRGTDLSKFKFAHLADDEADSSVGVQCTLVVDPGGFLAYYYQLKRPICDPHGKQLKGWGLLPGLALLG